MFKDAAALDRQRTATSFDKALSRYGKQAEQWFDGTVDSVDRRLGACDRLLHSVRFTVARLSSINDARRYLYAAGGLEEDRRALVALREDLLTGGAGREDVVGPPGWRHASPQEGELDYGGHPNRVEVVGTPVDWHDAPWPVQASRQAAKPPGAVAGSNEFENPAPRTKTPRYLNDSSVTKVRTKAQPVLKGGGTDYTSYDDDTGDRVIYEDEDEDEEGR